MRGTILGFDGKAGEGVINDADGRRVKFARAEWKGAGDPPPGRAVDYDLSGDRAVEVFPVPGPAILPSFDSQDPSRQAMVFGIVSLSCAVLTFFLGPIGIVTVIIAIIFGNKGKEAGRNLPDKTAYYLSVAGLVIAAISLVVTLLAIAALVGVLGAIGSLTAFR